jgi:hypothetical protein
MVQPTRCPTTRYSFELQHPHPPPPPPQCQYVPSLLSYPDTIAIHTPIHIQHSTNSPPSKTQAYNSIFNSEPDVRLIGNFPLLPLRTRTRGPAYTLPLLDPSQIPASQSPEPDSESYDALDEVLSLFRANTFFRNFEIQGPADRLLIYGILFVSECLGKVRAGMSARLVLSCCLVDCGGGGRGAYAGWGFGGRELICAI